jgi:hypothetical protein
LSAPSNRTLRGGEHTKRLKPCAALQIETAGFGGEFIRAVLLADDGSFEEFTTPAACLARLLTRQYRGVQIIAHNLDYVIRYFLDTLLYLADQNYTARVTCNGSGRVIWLRLGKHKNNWYISDTYALITRPLAELAPLAGRDTDGSPLGDCALLLAAYQRYCSVVLDNFSVAPTITASSTALRAWLASQPEHYHYNRQRPAIEELARQAYYTGFMYTKTASAQTDISVIDTNAMYAAVMRQGVPVLAGCLTGSEDTRYDAIYACRVEPPPGLPIYFVPRRTTERTEYPSSPFNTVLPSHSIFHARQYGYKITVSHGVLFEFVEPVFDAFLNKCEKLERELRPLDQAVIVKTLRNSLAGKFGQRPEGREYIITREPEPEYTPYVTRDGEYLDGLYYRDVILDRASMLPHWSAWIVNEARNRLIDTAYALGAEHVYYAYTDSLAVPTARLGGLALGSGYGQWRVVETYKNWRSLGDGVYTGETEAGQWSTRTKGVPRDSLDPADLYRLGLGDTLPVWYDALPRAMATVGGSPFVEHLRRDFALVP